MLVRILHGNICSFLDDFSTRCSALGQAGGLLITKEGVWNQALWTCVHWRLEPTDLERLASEDDDFLVPSTLGNSGRFLRCVFLVA